MGKRLVAIFQLQAMLLASALVAVLAKLALHDVTPFRFVWLQVGIGGLLLSAYTFGLRGRRIPAGLGPRAWLLIACVGLVNFCVVRFALLQSLARLPVNTHTFLMSFVGLVTMALSVALMREIPSRLQLLGGVLAVAGVRVFFAELPPPDERVGVAWLVLGVVGLATTNNLARLLPRLCGERLPNDVFSTVALWIGAVPLVVAGLVVDGWPSGLDARNWAIIAANGLFGIAVGLTLFNHVLRTLRSYEASIASGSGLVFTAFFAMPILGEYLDARRVAGIALLLCGMALAQLRGTPDQAVRRRAR